MGDTVEATYKLKTEIRDVLWNILRQADGYCRSRLSAEEKRMKSNESIAARTM